MNIGRFGLNENKKISFRSQNLTTADLDCAKAKIDIAEIRRLINPELLCLIKSFRQMFKVSGCVVYGLTDNFKDLICDSVNNYCPYYCNSPNPPFIRNLNNYSNSTDNSLSFFNEILENTDFSNSQLDIQINSEQDTHMIIDENTSDHMEFDFINENQIQKYKTFISENLESEELLVKNILKIISLGTIKSGKWLVSGNISINIPKLTNLSNLKIYFYLNDNIVQSGEIDLGSHNITNYNVIKSHSFNIMFSNISDGSEFKIGLLSEDNNNNIILLKTTNFFANLMN